MSLEEALAANTAAIVAQTEALVRHNEIMSGLKEKAAAAGTAASSKATTASTEKPADKPAETKTTTRGGSKAKAVTSEAFVKDAGGWLNEHTSGTDEFNERAAMLKKLAGHFSAERISAIAADKIVEANELLGKIKAGEDPFEEAGEEDGGVL